MSATLPIIQQLIDADGDRARAALLLRMPDSVVMRHADDVGDVCRQTRFDVGLQYVECRLALMLATRGADGLLPAAAVAAFEDFRVALFGFANGGGR